MQHTKRQYTLVDQLLIQANHCLTTLGSESPARRPYPAATVAESKMDTQQRKQSADFMRINHCGEVCAQALYNAQTLLARDKTVRQALDECGKEEADHLAWCHQRLNELNSHRSYLNFFWYWSAFTIGLVAAWAGDQWSLGFVEETEIQVGKHLQGHLNQISDKDAKSQAVIQQMQIDEAKHANSATEQGAKQLPQFMKGLMKVQAKMMTTVVRWL